MCTLQRCKRSPQFLRAGVSRAIIFPVLLAVFVWFATEISYERVASQAKPTQVHLGLVAVPMDINSYFSFVHQASNGHWLFTNNMTYMECDRAYINIQWLAVGKLMAFARLDHQQTFRLWRFAGAVVLLIGFTLLARAVLPRTDQQMAALIMFALGGGFGWFLAVLGYFGILDTTSSWGLKNPAADLIMPIHPFNQILKNPNYSLPHGVLLTAASFYVLGEKTNKARWYAMAAITTTLEGLMRPYDLATVPSSVALFIVCEALVQRRIEMKRAALRALPAIVGAPVLVYHLYLFRVHPVFKFWAEQGTQPPVPIHWHTLGTGLAGVLLVWRLLHIRKYPFDTPVERFLAVFAVSVLLLLHGNRLAPILSFSPQIGIPLMGPVILLSVALLPFRTIAPGGSQLLRHGPLVAFLALNAMSSPVMVSWLADFGAKTPRNYLDKAGVEAIAWLRKHASDTDVVLASEATGGKIGFLMPAKVAVGHFALSPNARTLDKQFKRFATGRMPREAAIVFLREVRPHYVYVDEPNALPPQYFQDIAGAELAYSNSGVNIYRIPDLDRINAEHATTSTP